jgi:uncharacterized protein DUF6734
LTCPTGRMLESKWQINTLYMKIIQSFWTKPFAKKEELHGFDRSKGGWPDKRYNYMSWALSCLQIRKIYGNVELITDKAGYELLINRLKLPYTSVRVVLDDLNDFHPDLWALGKIYTYLLQREPFMHLDGDVFIWERFPGHIEAAPLVAQNVEKGFGYYNDTYDSIKTKFGYIPDAIRQDREKNVEFVSVCAGIIGGQRTDFIREYAQTAIDMVVRNREFLIGMNIGLYNTFFEQYLFYCMARQRNLDICFYISETNDRFDGIADFTGVPGRMKFIHPVGSYKRRPEIAEHLANRLRKDHYEYYYRILNSLKTSEI